MLILLFHSSLFPSLSKLVDEKRSVLGKEFLNDVANQNYTKYAIAANANVTNSWMNQLMAYNQSGKMLIVNHRNTNEMFATAAAAVTDIWFRQEFIKPQIIVHQPFYDQSIKGKKIFSTTKPARAT